MVQAEFNHSTFNNGLLFARKVYTKEYVEKKCKIWRKSNQLGFDGWPFFTYNNLEEVDWVKNAILDALNHPENFNCRDTYGALCNLKSMIKGKNAKVLRSKYGLPIKLEYRNAYECNCIVDANHNDTIIIPLTAGEILDLIADLNKNREVNELFEVYEFHHTDVTIELLEKFERLYRKGQLNKLIKYICNKSNELGGFHDHGVGIIRNRLTSQYIFDNRRNDIK